MRRSAAVLLPVLALSALVACGGDDDQQEAATATQTTEESSPSSSSPSASDSPDPSSSPGEENPGKVLPRPAPGSCEPVPESADGRYVVADAGEVTLRMESGGLLLNVTSADGWNTSVDSDGDEADVEFRRGEDELDFEADLENGRLVIQICDDDD